MNICPNLIIDNRILITFLTITLTLVPRAKGNAARKAQDSK